MTPPDDDPLAPFGAATREWFTRAFAQATRVQREGWRSIATGAHTLLLAPTGSGKTLAAFLWCIDRLSQRDSDEREGFRAIYVSPLKALAYDVERNLRAPLVGIERAAERLGETMQPLRVAVRTGDTPERERRRIAKHPGDILITTPESLYLLLGQAARETLATVDTIILDEIHALAPSKRGAHLALSLERLVELTGREPQRIGLSATQRPLEEIARYLGGDRPVTIVDASEKPHLDLTIEVPVEDMEQPPRPALPAPSPVGKRRGRRRLGTLEEVDAQESEADFTFGEKSETGFTLRGLDEPGGEAERGVWPAIYPRLLALVRAHRSTIVFTNSRRLCERLAQRINELAALDRSEAVDGEELPLVRAHHGSIARAQREEIEELLKSGALRGIVATSSLELGIDMGAVDLVIQIEAPASVSQGLQRVGRAGHAVGERSIGRIFPKFRGDLLEAAVVARRMLDGAIESTRVPRNPLDVLAQQIVAMCAEAEWTPSEIERVVKRAYSFQTLSRELLVGVLDMLAGRYPSEAFADLRPRLVWDRTRDVLVGRRDARLLALVSGGTIPDRGLYGVYLGAGGPRVGELDEEMVHESRAGQTFLLGASTWRIVEITRDRVIVEPAPGEPGKMPFWRGEGPGRPVELGRALGAFVGQLGTFDEREGCAWLEREYHLDERAARNLWRYVAEQRASTGTLPTDRAITVEKFRDELGDWRVCILSPFGARVHAPWALALEARLGKSAGFAVQTLWSDDGIVLRCADTEEALAAESLLPDPDELEELVLEELGRSALFATHFRENAARALLLPRRRPGLRTPLWSQRLRAQNLLAVASQHPGFPIVLETYREILHDVFDVPSLVELLRAIRRREVRVVEVETPRASPFARSLAFAYVAAYLYEGDAPLAERKAQALTLDRNLLRELLGQDELRDLLDPAALDEVEAELQWLVEDRHARHADALHDLLRRIGDLDEGEIRARSDGDPAPWLDQLRKSGRAVRLRIGNPATERWVAIEDVARYRDALGAQPPAGLPSVFLAPTTAPLESLVARYARTHAGFTASQVAARFGLLAAQVEPVLRSLAQAGRLVEGELRPTSQEPEWCDVDVLRTLRRRTLARLRREVAPVEAAVLARFLPRWHGVTGAEPATGDDVSARPRRGGLVRLREVLEQLEGLPLPFSELERSILPARVADFQPRMLDELGALGEVVWVGRGALGPGDGRVALYRRERVALLADAPEGEPPSGELHRKILAQLGERGASFYAQLQAACGDALSDEILGALWDLVWAGLVTNDTFQPLRALRSKPQRGRVSVLATGGRWSLTSELRAGKVSDTERVHARATTLLERYGVVSREAVSAEGWSGGWASVQPVLRAMEDTGKLRRGYFVDGLGGAQYAQPGAVDRLRAARSEGETPDVVTLAAVDPANPYGVLLPWPGIDGGGDGEGSDDGDRDGLPLRPRRVAGAAVVLVRGQPVFFVDGHGTRLRCFVEDGEDPAVEAALVGLRELAARRRHRELRIEKIDGVPALRSAHAGLLKRAGFRSEPGGLVLSLPASPSLPSG